MSRDVEGSWFVVPGPATGELTGFWGEGSFTAAVGESAAMTLDHWSSEPSRTSPSEGIATVRNTTRRTI